MVVIYKNGIFATDIAERTSNMDQINSEACIGCQLLGHCGSTCETSDSAGSDSSAWGKLLLPCILLLAVVLLVGASYLINKVF